jgi:hypothetical protein
MEPPRQFSEEEIASFERHLDHQRVWLQATQKHLFPAQGSIDDLAVLLTGWQAWHLAGCPPLELKDGESEEAWRYKVQAKRFRELLNAASATKDAAFFERLAKACRKQSLVQPVDALGLVVLVFRELRCQHRRRPTRAEVWARVEALSNEGGKKVSEHRWRQILRDPLIAALFREG